MHTYRLYGLCVKSQWLLSAPEISEPGLEEVELFEGQASFFARASQEAAIQPESTKWSRYARLNNGADYVRWPGFFEVVISANGRQIAARPIGKSSWEAFQAYLLGQAFSYSLIKLGIEPLHATVVVIDGHAVAFLGDTGYGKSCLAASFLKAGYRLLTDDLLVLKKIGNKFLAYPGPPRIKLFPKIARTFLNKQNHSSPMNPFTTKLVIPLRRGQSSRDAQPLRAIYLLRPPKATAQSKRVTLRKCSQRGAFLDLISNTFNTKVVHPDRLTQQFALATQIVASIPIKSLSYPRDLSRLSEVVERIRADLT